MEAVIEEGRKAGKACIMLQQVRTSRPPPPTCLLLINGLTAWLAGLVLVLLVRCRATPRASACTSRWGSAPSRTVRKLAC